MAALNPVGEDGSSLTVKESDQVRNAKFVVRSEIAAGIIEYITTTCRQMSTPLISINCLIEKVQKHEISSDLSGRISKSLARCYEPDQIDPKLLAKLTAWIKRGMALNGFSWPPMQPSKLTEEQALAALHQRNVTWIEKYVDPITAGLNAIASTSGFLDPKLFPIIYRTLGKTSLLDQEVMPFVQRAASAFLSDLTEQDWKEIQAVFEKNKFLPPNRLQQMSQRQVQKAS
jgi:hypothetical protein